MYASRRNDTQARARSYQFTIASPTAARKPEKEHGNIPRRRIDKLILLPQPTHQPPIAPQSSAVHSTP
ncbi:hypothetical protein K438DRAFT_1863272 [Mycena galopus ATCC 62051]|nr:hypothetical protein K438DRAFT_1863272 [Mycena galopus ATCC 62051]